MGRMTATLVAVILVALVVAGCGGNNGEEAETETVPPAQGDPAEGERVFQAQGCGGCHTFAAADSSGSTGPNLDESLEGDDPAQVQESIVDPDAEITEGFSAGVMPQDYGDKLSEQQLADLVAFLTQTR